MKHSVHVCVPTLQQPGVENRANNEKFGLDAQKYRQLPPPNPCISEMAFSHRFQKVHTYAPLRNEILVLWTKNGENPENTRICSALAYYECPREIYGHPSAVPGGRARACPSKCTKVQHRASCHRWPTFRHPLKCACAWVAVVVQVGCRCQTSAIRVTASSARNLQKRHECQHPLIRLKTVRHSCGCQSLGVTRILQAQRIKDHMVLVFFVLKWLSCF